MGMGVMLGEHRHPKRSRGQAGDNEGTDSVQQQPLS